MTRKTLYLILAVIGLIVPYYFLISFVTTYGVDPRQFFHQLFGAPISTFFSVDLIISGVVFLVFLHSEGLRLSMKHRWIYLLALCAVGLSFALPLFLWAREGHLNSGE